MFCTPNIYKFCIIVWTLWNMECKEPSDMNGIITQQQWLSVKEQWTLRMFECETSNMVYTFLYLIFSNSASDRSRSIAFIATTVNSKHMAQLLQEKNLLGASSPLASLFREPWGFWVKGLWEWLLYYMGTLSWKVSLVFWMSVFKEDGWNRQSLYIKNVEFFSVRLPRFKIIWLIASYSVECCPLQNRELGLGLSD